MESEKLLKIGTCSWKYDSWVGLIYSETAKANYLKEYAAHYSTVEVDQWFWSLFKGHKPKLPDMKTVRQYGESVPDDFRFTIKVPNAVTLTHYYSKSKSQQPEENPYFLSNDLFSAFLEKLEPLRGKMGPLMFQFEYLNKKKMPNQEIFLEKMSAFIETCPGEYQYAVETRNPNYLNEEYFSFLHAHGLSHVFLEGYYMPSIVGILNKYLNHLNERTLIRLHGADRKGIEKKTGKKWNDIVDSKDSELNDILRMVRTLLDKGLEIYINVNNHYEGSAPRTIEKILQKQAIDP